MEIKISISINSSISIVNASTGSYYQSSSVSDENVQAGREADRKRFDVDQQSLTVVEREQGNNGNRTTLAEDAQVEREVRSPRFEIERQAVTVAEQGNDYGHYQHNRTAYDQPSQHSQTAVAAYENISNLDNRENIQKLFGVDFTV